MPCHAIVLLYYFNTIHLIITIELQHYIKLTELEKNRKLNDLLDALDFNQVVIFVKSVSRAAELNKLLVECNFPSICIHSGMSQEERFVKRACSAVATFSHTWHCVDGCFGTLLEQLEYPGNKYS